MNFLCTPENLLETIEKGDEYKHIAGIQGDGNAGDRIVKILKDNI